MYQFSKRFSTSVSLLLILPEFGACLAQNNTAREQPEPRAIRLKGLPENVWTKSLTRSDITKTRSGAENCSKWWQG